MNLEHLSGIRVVSESTTPCFDELVTSEIEVWRRCSNAQCGRVFRFGDPKRCPICNTSTELEGNIVKHGLSAYRHGLCKCDICRQANREDVTRRRRQTG